MAGDPTTKSSWFPTDPNVDPTDLGDAVETDPRQTGGTRPSLVRVWSPAAPAVETFPLDTETIDLGRGVTGPGDVRIRGDGRVSRRHARITVEDGQVKQLVPLYQPDQGKIVGEGAYRVAIDVVSVGLGAKF